MKTFESLEEIIDFAIEQEQLAVEFYTKLATKALSDDMRKTFEEFAREEIGHKAKLTKFKAEGISVLPKEKSELIIKLKSEIQHSEFIGTSSTLDDSYIIKDSTIEGITYQEKKESLNSISLMYNNYLDFTKRKNQEDIAKGELPIVLNHSQIIKRIVPIIKKQISNEKVHKIVDELLKPDSAYRFEFNIYLSQKRNVLVEESLDEEKLLTRDWDDSSNIKSNPLKTAPDKIKNFINNYIVRTDNGAIDANTLGLKYSLDWKDVSSKILLLVHDKNSPIEMLDTLIEYGNAKRSKIGHTFVSMANDLKDDKNEDLRNAFFKTFKKMMPDANILNIERLNNLYNVSIKTINKTSYSNTIAYEIADRLVSNKKLGMYDTELKELLEIKLDVLSELMRSLYDNKTEIINASYDILTQLGVYINRQVYEDMMSDKDYVGTIQDVQTFLITLLRTTKTNKSFLYNDKTTFDEYTLLFKITDRIAYYSENPISLMYTNVEGEQQSSAISPNYIYQMMNTLSKAVDENADKDEVNQLLYNRVNSPSLKHLPILWGNEYNSRGDVIREGLGLINYITIGNEKVPFNNELTITEQDLMFTCVNNKNLNNFKAILLAGTKNRTNEEAKTYASMDDTEWKYFNFIMFTNGYKEVGNFPIITPSDSTTSYLIQQPVYRLAEEEKQEIQKRFQIKAQELIKKYKLKESEIKQFDFTKLFGDGDIKSLVISDIIKDSPLFKALIDTITTDVDKYKNALAIFEVNEYGEFILDENEQPIAKLPINKLLKDYHFKVDSKGKEYFIKDGKLVGDAFKFIQSTVNGHSLLDVNGRSVIKNNRIALDANKTIEIHSMIVLRELLLQYIKEYEPVLPLLIDSVTGSEQVSIVADYDGTETSSPLLSYWHSNLLSQMIEFSVNSFINNTNQQLLFTGSVNMYGNYLKLNKRAKQISTTKELNGVEGGCNMVTINDPNIKSKVINAQIELFETSYKLINPTLFKDVEVDKKKINKEVKDLSNLNILERTIYDKIKPYFNIDIADATSFILDDEFERRNRAFGREEEYKDVMTAIREDRNININTTNRLLQLQKNFYYNYQYDSILKEIVPIQIKNAEVILTRQLAKTLNIEPLYNYMKEFNVGQLNMATASKAATYGNCNILKGKEELVDNYKEILTAHIKILEYKYLGQQQEVPDHIIDEENVRGVQFVKQIITNIPKDHVYSEGTGEEVINELFDLTSLNIFDSAVELLNEFADITTKDNNIIINSINDKKLKDILIKKAIDNGISNESILALKNGMPLYIDPNHTKWKELLLSMFNTRVIRQKMAGIHAYQMSNFLMDTPTVARVSDISGKGINWLNSKLQDQSLKLKYHTLAGKRVTECEVLLPRTYKEFFRDGQAIDINEVYEQAPELLEMIGYRIPTEAKHSMINFKIVGFLPDSMGAVIVMPDEIVAQTGSNFDIDSIYMMQYTAISKGSKFKKNKYIISKEDFNEMWDFLKYNKKWLSEILTKRYNADTAQEYIDDYNKIRDKLIGLLQDKKSILSNIDSYIKEDTNRPLVINIKERLKVIYNLLPITIDVNEKNLLRDEQLELQVRLQELIDISRELPNIDEEYKSIQDEIKLVIEDSLSNYTILNTKEQRDNRIIDLSKSILSDVIHATEVMSVSGFTELIEVKRIINKILGKNEVVEGNTGIGQGILRSRAMQTVELKGKSVSNDGELAILQVADARIKYAIPHEYNKSDFTSDQLERIKSDYKESYIDKGDTFVVNFKHIGNNPAGTFINIKGEYITEYKSYLTANVLDAIKETLVEGIDDYYINAIALFANIGMTYYTGVLYANQPIIKEVRNLFFKNNNVFNDKVRSEINDIKVKYQLKLIDLIAAKEKEEGRIDTIDKRIAGYVKINKDKTTIYIKKKLRNKFYKELGYIEGDFSIQSDSKLKDSLFNKLDTIDEIRNQLKILENWITISETGSQMVSVASMLNTDKGKLTKNASIVDNTIEKINNYSFGDTEALIVDANDDPITISIYNNETSKYKSLQSYLQYGYMTAGKVLNNIFIDRLDFIKTGIDVFVPNISGKETLTNKFQTYILSSLRAKSTFFNSLYEEDYIDPADAPNTILGIDNIVLNTKELKDIPLEDFKQLCTANKCDILKRYFLANDDEVLTKLISSLTLHIKEVSHNFNGYYRIDAPVVENLDSITESWKAMFESNNPYVKDTAYSLLKYAMLTDGMNFTKFGLSKFIPEYIMREQLNFYEEMKSLETNVREDNDKYNGIKSSSPTAYIDGLAFTTTINIADLFQKFTESNYRNNALVPEVSSTEELSNMHNEKLEANLLSAIQTNDTSVHGKVISYEKFKFFKRNVRNAEYVKIKKFDSDTKTYNYYLFKKIDKTYINNATREIEGLIYYVQVSTRMQYDFSDHGFTRDNNSLSHASANVLERLLNFGCDNLVMRFAEEFQNTFKH